MTNLVFDGFGRDERIAEDKSQWFTTMSLARRLVAWSFSGSATTVPRAWATILEPSAGSGNLAAAVREFAPLSLVIACEIDPYYVERLSERFAEDRDRVSIVEGNYLERPSRTPEDPWTRYDLGLANSPYEGGLDGLFLAKMMDECRAITVLMRLVALAGKERGADVWARCSPGGDWALRKLAILTSRPAFEAGRAIGSRDENIGGAADFCALHLSLRSRDERGINVPCFPEWWSP